MTNNSTLLFDVDGTILDSFAGIKESFEYALTEHHIPLPSTDFISKIAGPPMRDTLSQLKIAPETSEKIVATYTAHYAEIGWKKTTVFPGAAEYLARLAQEGKILATATSKMRSMAEKMLEHFQLRSYFQVICGANDDGTDREKKVVIGKALQATNGNPAKSIMVGDRIFDIEGGKSWNIPTIYVKWGFGNPAEENLADHVANDFNELATLTERLLHV